MKLAAPPKTEKNARPRAAFFVSVAFLLCLATFLLCPRLALPVPACPEAALLRQPDGTAFRARRVGDERWHFTETEEGYTIVQDRGSGFWFYAIEENGRLRKSRHPVGKVSPKTLGLKLCVFAPSPDASSVPFLSLSRQDAKPGGVAAKPKTIKSLVILARFADHMFYNTQDQFNRLFNEPGYSADGAVGSVRGYYLDVSAGQLTIDSTVSAWVSLPHNESVYGADNADGEDSNPGQLVRDAVQALHASGFDFRPFDADRDGEIDMLTIIHSGLAQEFAGNPSDAMWSQVVNVFPAETADGVRVYRAAIAPERRYSTTSITRIGVICHEMGHLLGLPDLYDIDGSSSGIGAWGIMGAGSWGGDGHSPERPVHFCAWSKVKLGWVVPTQIDGSDSPVSVSAIEKAGSWGIYKISCEMPGGEYLLIENRGKTGYDFNLTGQGLLVWHIDDNQSRNDDESHYMVGLLQADASNDLENGTNRGDAGDPFPGSSNKRVLDDTTSPSTASYHNGSTYIAISNISDASATMTFDISTLTDIYSQDFSGGLSGNWEVVDDQNDGYTWTDQNPGSRSDPNWSGKFMIADSDAAGWRSMNEQLISTEYDCSLYVHLRIQFNHYFRASSGQTGDVDLRVDGGKWQRVARYKFDDDSGTKNVDISSLADGRASVQIRWHFYNISYGWYWGIDDVAIRGEPPANSPPQIAITNITQRTDGSAGIEIRFIGTDQEGNPASWATEHCQYAPSPYTTWQPLVFDTADPANTAIEPMPFTATGKGFLAVVDASAWDGLYQVKLRVTDGVTSNPAVISEEFSVDNTSAQVVSPTHLQSNPSSGDTSITALATWSDPNWGTTRFQLKLNDGSWSVPVKGNPYGGSSEGARFSSLSLDGDDYLTVQSYHVDFFGNRSEESVSPQYYVTPLTPSFPTFRDVGPNSLVIVVHPNSAERGNVDYAVYCSTVDQYVDWQGGAFVDAPGWGDYSQWGGSAGTTVTGLEPKTRYMFQVMAANPNNHDLQSPFSLSGSRRTANSPPNRPASLLISPEDPFTSDDLVCAVTPASPPDADPGDTVSYRFTWSCPGKGDVIHGPKPDLTDVFPSDNTGKGQTWTCTVEGYDQQDYGEPLAWQVLIANTPPSIEVLGQPAAYAGQSIQLLIVGSDADDDDTTITVPNNPPDATLIQNGDGTATFLWPNPGVEFSQDVAFAASDDAEETSMDLSLTFSEQPFEIAAIGKSAGQGGKPTVITWYGLPGVSYSIRRSAGLVSWESVASGISLPEGSTDPDWLSYQEEIGSSPTTRRYYRLGM